MRRKARRCNALAGHLEDRAADMWDVTGVGSIACRMSIRARSRDLTGWGTEMGNRVSHIRRCARGRILGVRVGARWLGGVVLAATSDRLFRATRTTVRRRFCRHVRRLIRGRVGMGGDWMEERRSLLCERPALIRIAASRHFARLRRLTSATTLPSAAMPNRGLMQGIAVMLRLSTSRSGQAGRICSAGMAGGVSTSRIRLPRCPRR